MAVPFIERSVWGATLLAVLGTGLMSGVFFAFSSFVMKALGELPAPQGIAAMQSINTMAVTPLFMVAFFGSTAICVLLAIYSLMTWHQRGAAVLLLGSLLYLAGAVVTTAMFNVPLNNALARMDPASLDGVRFWTRYLLTWSAWNHVRAAGSLLSAAAFAVALSRLSGRG